MPVVTVQLWAGRTIEQKRALVRALTDAMVAHAGARPDHLHVVLQEVEKHNWGRAGMLGSDLPAEPAAAAPAQEPPQEPATLGFAHLLLQARELAEAEAFYLDLLRFTVRKRDRLEDGRPLIVTHQGLGITNGGGAANRSGNAAQVEHFAFRVRGVAGLAERARRAGVRVIRELGPGAYGLTVYLADPDGNKIELFEEIA
jgi:4-oxalocrotonate tautomerase family enzyme